MYKYAMRYIQYEQCGQSEKNTACADVILQCGYKYT